MSLRHIQESIAQWGRETFGKPGVPPPPGPIAARMNVEVAELLVGLSELEATAPGSQERRDLIHALGEECADIGIMLVQVADALRDGDAPGIDLEQYMAAKMHVNRQRSWGRTANGKVQHVEVADCGEAGHEEQRCGNAGCSSPIRIVNVVGVPTSEQAAQIAQRLLHRSPKDTV